MRYTKRLKEFAVVIITMLGLSFFAQGLAPMVHVSAAGSGSKPMKVNLGGPTGKYTCGGGNEAVHTEIDIGCAGKGNPITDAAFAIIRVLSDGVGLVIIASVVYGGIQYSSSGGDPNATSQAIHRIRESLIALLIFIFGYAILNYLIPAGFLH